MSPRTERDAVRQSSRGRDALVVERSGGQRRVHGSRHVDVAAAADGEAATARVDLTELPRERSLAIEVNGRPVATLLCTPDAPAELAVGWAFTHGFLDERAYLQRVSCHPARVSLMIDTPGAGVSSCLNGIESHDQDEEAANWRIPPSRLQTVCKEVFAQFRDQPDEESVHHAAIGDDRRIWAIARDLSRDNAVDKIVGWTLLEARPREEAILFLSGRIGSDIIFRTWRAGIPIVASRALPTHEAVSLAEARHVTIVGRALDSNPTVYSHAWRVSE